MIIRRQKRTSTCVDLISCDSWGSCAKLVKLWWMGSRPRWGSLARNYKS
jgi:hypothetical protein